MVIRTVKRKIKGIMRLYAGWSNQDDALRSSWGELPFVLRQEKGVRGSIS